MALSLNRRAGGQKAVAFALRIRRAVGVPGDKAFVCLMRIAEMRLTATVATPTASITEGNYETSRPYGHASLVMVSRLESGAEDGSCAITTSLPTL